jgi:hypothetical protein
MTRRDMKYIVSHYEAAQARIIQNCLNHKCKGCPMSEGVTYCNKTNIIEDVDKIRRRLK